MKTKAKNPLGMSTKSNSSYFEYLKAGLDLISSKLSIRVYKLAPKDDYPIFERGKDIRVKIFWNKEPKYEFIVENSFFYRKNTNKTEREDMRSWADLKLEMFKDAVERGKNASKATKT